MSVKTIIAETKKGKGQVTQFLEKENEEAEQEYANTKLKRLIAEEKARINELGAEGKKPEAHVSSDLLSHIMDLAQVNPVKAKEFLTSLNEDDLGKLAVISSMGQNGGMNNLLPMLKGGSNMQDIIAVVKLLQDNRQPKESGMDWKGAAELFKAGVEAAKAQQPVNPQNDLQYKMMENSLAEAKATREEMSNQNRLRYEREIADLKSRPSEIDVLLSYEEKAEKFRKARGGTDSAVINEWALKKLDMEQNKDIEDRRQDWAEKKWEKEQEGQGKMIEQVGGIIKTVSEGPVKQILEALGKKGKEQMRGSETPNSSTSQAASVQTECPNGNCHKIIYVDPTADSVQCPYCQAVLQKQTPTPQQASETPQATQQTVEVPAETETNGKVAENAQ